MKHPHDGWKPKRYDPEPADEADPLVVVLWCVVVALAVVIVANYLGTHVGTTA